ncbi:hypothetical protein D3C86_1242470 [compost metagenome]
MSHSECFLKRFLKEFRIFQPPVRGPGQLVKGIEMLPLGTKLFRCPHSDIELMLNGNRIPFQLFVNDGALGVEVDLRERQMARVFDLLDLALDRC